MRRPECWLSGASGNTLQGGASSQSERFVTSRSRKASQLCVFLPKNALGKLRWDRPPGLSFCGLRCHTGNLRVLLCSSRGVCTGHSQEPWRSWSAAPLAKSSSAMDRRGPGGCRCARGAAAWFIYTILIYPEGQPVEDHQGHQESFGTPGQCHPRAHRPAVLAR